MCDEIIDAEETKTIPKIQSVKQKVYILLAFLLITIALLIAFSTYFYLIILFIAILCHKWQINKCFKNMDSNDELKEINIKNRRCYYFDDIIKLELISIMFKQMNRWIYQTL